ncbi:TRAP transporter large permease [Spiribacter curvatus]|nr:TRAP transporter large permease subunit [Spiribacter curvatus]
MSPQEVLALLMLAGFMGMILIGIPVGISLATSGLLFGFLGFGSTLFDLLPSRIYGVVTNYTLLAIPLFVFMGVMLEKSKIADALLETLGHAMGGLRGGMGIAIVLVGVLMGAATGIVGATVVTVGLLTLPVLMRRGYSRSVACGTICASGTLGQILPPSLVLILLSDILGESVGSLFAAALFPGLMLAAVYVIYLLVLGMVRPETVPPIPQSERDSLSGSDLLFRLVKSVAPTILLVFAVLGSIIGGVAAPTEAASMGAAGSIVIALVSRRLDRPIMAATLKGTVSISAMVFFILICAQPFALAFRGLGGEHLVEALFALLPGGLNAELLFMMLLLFILGFFLEWIEISYIALPMFLPIFQAAGVDMVWFGILVAMNLQASFLTPPFGWALFFLKGVSPPGITTRDIYIGVLPFIALQLIGLGLLFIFPQMATWLPAALGW